jgi:hypothetical protein
MQDVPRQQCAADERGEEPNQPNDTRLPPFAAENQRIELRARQKRQEDRSDHQLCDGAHHDLAQRRRELEPDREQRGDERKTNPDRGDEPHVFHDVVLCVRLVRR